jgi:iron-sulfur cluster assembly protein
MIQLTEAAIRKVRQTMQQQNIEGGLRLGVQGGGCSGLSYLIRFDPQAGPRDRVFEFEGLKVFVDPKSYVYLHGMTLDWKEDLMQSGFVFVNPNAKNVCGCGTSFSAG